MNTLKRRMFAIGIVLGLLLTCTNPALSKTANPPGTLYYFWEIAFPPFTTTNPVGEIHITFIDGMHRSQYKASVPCMAIGSVMLGPRGGLAFDGGYLQCEVPLLGEELVGGETMMASAYFLRVEVETLLKTDGAAANIMVSHPMAIFAAPFNPGSGATLSAFINTITPVQGEGFKGFTPELDWVSEYAFEYNAAYDLPVASPPHFSFFINNISRDTDANLGHAPCGPIIYPPSGYSFTIGDPGFRGTIYNVYVKDPGGFIEIK